MKQIIIELWADIGSETYWRDLISKNPFVFCPFDKRWPQPGFIGRGYFESDSRIVVMGQNPRASNTPESIESDTKMFDLIRIHSKCRSADSLNDLFVMMRSFMKGIDYKPAWKPITAVREHLKLDLDDMAYLNLIPLATCGDRIVPAFEDAYRLSTMLQLQSLDPGKVIVFGKGAYQKFERLGGTSEYDSLHVGQRSYKKDAPPVRRWLKR